MCLLTVFPMPDLMTNAQEERLMNGGDCNPHGHGWAVVTGSRITVGKSLDLEHAVETFREAYERATGPALFHSRWATHGAKDLANTHPFPVRKLHNTYLAHNGIMPAESCPTGADTRSDTRVFADDILPIRYRRLDSPKVRANLSMWLRGNKVAVLTTNRAFRRQLYVFGLAAGEWQDGVWFSNNDHSGWHYRWASDSKPYEDVLCEWCHSKTVNAWAICDTCHTCQDCLEPERSCLCFTGPEQSTAPAVLEAAKEVDFS